MIVILLITASLCTFGIDFENNLGVSEFACLKTNNIDLLVIRGYRSFGALDPYVNSNIKNARAAGYKSIDVYMFPCVKCGNPKGQVDTMISGITELYNMIWVDIEIFAWPDDKAANKAFILEIVNEIKNKGKTVGIYSSANNWQSIVGTDWTGVSALPLWYAHYDNVKAFSDFKPFGGWTKPAMKQFTDNSKLCGVVFDEDFF